ncbi:2-C-methyl-D-erythritol 4-phosphate cytidylyltransferase [Deinococcus aquiradiocola]|uniref:2-C-methyl-D-erythritol 4-phosphate cytidylyltransferase n=1 Tax=Deinococcus aquiradiocola TaxID=393059 RepID=A0A917UQ27_9DEIO|nr:2-C-methyl-D-erythritol 4-phosphate cytidylyltransferase [Deinococcus aquiradiocola]GGJ74333.1 2-C-methyl-D-erythritol 4-phosphate cytidylyltransferase [Deinococcus aquiradiocola]
MSAGRVAALIPAAGSGTRLGRGPKAYVTVAGRTLLERSVEALRPHVSEVIVALPEGETLPAGVRARAVTGGGTRQDSVRLLLEASDADVVLVHDAARPFLGAGTVRAVLDAARASGAATVALPVADTLVRADGTGWGERVERAGLWAVQTPQAGRRDWLLAAHTRAAREGHAATDDAGLLHWAGHAVTLVPGEATLFKVTTPGDLQLAEALAAMWDAAQP